METAHIPALFSKQGWLRPCIVQGSTVHYRLSVGPGGWTAACLERLTIVVLSRKEAAELGKIFTSTNSTHTLIRRLGIEKKQQLANPFTTSDDLSS